MKKKIIAVMLSLAMCFASFTGCTDNEIKLDPKNPITIDVWHYYNGENMSAFDGLVEEFNDSVGKKKGIIVQSVQMGSTTDIENALLASANKEAGAMELPAMYLAYSDTTYTIDSLGLVADVNKYFSESELSSFKKEFLDEGKINGDEQLKIIPIAKSTECFLLNDTDWKIFADETGATYEQLSTLESLADVAESYYNWTDAKTPDIPNDGKAFYGRDSIANMFVVNSKSFDVEIYGNLDNERFVNVDDTVMRKIWDYYYVPYISGYYTAIGRFRSDDMKIGEVLAYIGSTSSTSYFPEVVTPHDGEAYPVDFKVLQMPKYADAKDVRIQQGAGMVVTKSNEKEEYAACEFIKFFTQKENNIEFSGKSGYLPVKNDALNYDTIKTTLDSVGYEMRPITDTTLKVTLEKIDNMIFYTNKPFAGGIEARNVLESFGDKCTADRQTVIDDLATGTSLKNAVAKLNTDENFNIWLTKFKSDLGD